MDDLVMTFLIWDLRVALALAAALAVIVVLQGVYRGAVALVHRAASAADVVRVPAPRTGMRPASRATEPVGAAR